MYVNIACHSTEEKTHHVAFSNRLQKVRFYLKYKTQCLADI